MNIQRVHILSGYATRIIKASELIHTKKFATRLLRRYFFSPQQIEVFIQKIGVKTSRCQLWVNIFFSNESIIFILIKFRTNN